MYDQDFKQLYFRPFGEFTDRVVSYNGDIVFSAKENGFGEDLYRYNGSTTTRLRDFAAGTNNSRIESMFLFKDELYTIVKQDGFDEFEIWKIDKDFNFSLIKDFENEGFDFQINVFVDDEVVFFEIVDGFDKQIWTFDGTLQGTQFQMTIPESNLSGRIAVNGKFYYSLERGNKNKLYVIENGSPLEVYDGNDENYTITNMRKVNNLLFIVSRSGFDNNLVSINPQNNQVKIVDEISFGGRLFPIEEELYLYADLGEAPGGELYQYNFNTGELDLVVDIREGFSNSSVLNLRKIESGDLIMSADIEFDNRQLIRVIKSNYTPYGATLDVIGEIRCSDDEVDVVVRVEGGQPPYDISWNTNLTKGDTLIGVPGLSVVAMVTDGNGDRINLPISFEDLDRLFVLVNDVVSADANMSNGSIDMDVFGGYPPYVFNWDNGADTEDLMNIPGGPYILTVTDSLGCEKKDTIEVPIISDVNNIETNKLKLKSDISTNELVLLNVEDHCNISIIAQNGQLIRSNQTYWKGASIDISNLKAGYYFLRTEYQSKVQTLSFMKLD